MGRIKKIATERHLATLSPFVRDFVKEATEAPLYKLPALLASFPQHWPLPRGDLYHWIALLDRFDHVLESFVTEYALNDGPQTQPFERRLLQKGDAAPSTSSGAQMQELDNLGYSSDGDRELMEAILNFTRILLEHCGNRSLYASSTHLGNLLNTISLSLLWHCEMLCLRLAQRYQVARYKNHHPAAQAMLLANHYNINLETLHTIASAFPRPSNSSAALSQAPATPARAKDKGPQSVTFNPVDLVAIAKEPLSATTKSDLSNVALSYYEQSASVSLPDTAIQPTEASPATPTPSRRTSNLGPSRDRPSTSDRAVGASDAASTPVISREADNSPSTAPKVFHITASEVAKTPAWLLVKNALPNLPVDMHYDLLNRVRIAKVFASEETSRQELLEIRLLAIANLAYAHTESKFQEKIGIPDGEEPRQFHLAQQLSDLLQPATHGQTSLALRSETTVLMTLEALTRSRHKVSEVADALAITVNHGVLYYELRKVIATLDAEEYEENKTELQAAAWRESTFDLINSLLQSNAQARYGEKMVSAGLMSILVEALNLRTTRAERLYERVLQFFDSFVHGIPTAFQTLAQVKGLDVIADLTAHQVEAAFENARQGHGLPNAYKSKVVDYGIPFYQQSTLRQLFKNTVHMFEHNSGTHDRLLRNLIDTPQILGALRKVVENAPVFGSNVWSGAVNIVSSFIHNEPTSYQVIGEAGLSRSFLESITRKKLPEDLPSVDDKVPGQEKPEFEVDASGEPSYPCVEGILPVGEVMCDIPTAFEAICLNESGAHLFQASGALDKYFNIFVSPIHVRAMDDDPQTATTIGHSFDELSRHQPRLQDQIMAAVLDMLKRLKELCLILAEHKRSGAKLWEASNGRLRVAGGQSALRGLSSVDCEEAFAGATGLLAPKDRLAIEDDGTEDSKERTAVVPFLSACFKFLEGLFHNSTMCSLFCEESGAELLLDLATSPGTPHDFVAFPLFNKITQVLKTMCEAKAALVFPSIIRRMQHTMLGLKSLMANESPSSSFLSFTDFSKPTDDPFAGDTNGTIVVKSLVSVHLLTYALGRILAPPPYTLRHGNQNHQYFVNLNFTEIYLQFIDEYSKLQAACLWEGLLLMRDIPDHRRLDTEPKPCVLRRIDANGVVEVVGDRAVGNSPLRDVSDANVNRDSEESGDRKVLLANKNLRTIRYLLHQVPVGIESFFHSLSQAIVTKRMEAVPKQHATFVADRLAHALIWELDFRRCEPDDRALETTYAAGVLAMISRIVLRNSYSIESLGTKEALSLVLTKFYVAGGFAKLNDYLDRFVRILSDQQQGDDVEGHFKDAIHSILDFYSHLVRSKCINEATQTSAILNRDRTAPDYFQPGQFLVEIRDAVLPAISKIWHSKDIENFSDTGMRLIVDILRFTLKAEGEDRPLRRSDQASRRVLANPPDFKLANIDGLERLTVVLGFDPVLSREALYRCNNHSSPAEAYCRLRLKDRRVPRFPIPEGESPTATAPAPDPSAPPNAEDNGDVEMLNASEDGPGSIEAHNAHANAQSNLRAETLTSDVSSNPLLVSASDNDITSDDDDDDNLGTLGRLPVGLRAEDLSAMADTQVLDIINVAPPVLHSRDTLQSKDTRQQFATLDDLDDKRQSVRDDLIDRCLDVLSTQRVLTFDLADLIQAAVAKAGEGANPRADIGATLVSSLMSLQAEESWKESGFKIQAYAHLVALILQDRDFFDSTLDELKEYFGNLVAWVRLSPDQKAEDAPWIETVLLIVERVLAEDEQPVEIEWESPPADNPLKPMPLLSTPEPVVSQELRSQLLDALIDLLPKIGKNRSLALSVSRVLVVLTRRRDLAARLSDKHSMGRLFLMIRQLARVVHDKLLGSFMLILRHMVEDDETIRRFMRAEIKSAFDNYRPSRAMDTTSYARNMFHLALRSPQIFVEVTQEMLEITRFDGNPHRAQSLALKRDKPPATNEISRTQSSTSTAEGEDSEVQKSNESKFPAVETTDGVIQFLLRELSNYKDVEDKPPLATKDTQEDQTKVETSPDIEMSDAVEASASTSLPNVLNKAKRPTFNPEDHAIFLYRSFILQCLTELLTCYNRTKIEFIGFSRKSEVQPATPSKPRSGTLNYLLNVLLPNGTLEHRDDVSHSKKVAISNWTASILVSLCTKTQERVNGIRAYDATDFSEQEPELTFVRRFVIDHAIRAFREATVSSEALDQRYSRLLALGDLFNRMLNEKMDVFLRSNTAATGNFTSHRQMGRLMYEKNLIGVLTSAIAELDLNFPNAKRAVKYVLGPLKQLTELGVTLSQTSDISSLTGPATSKDEDDSSSAASLSGAEEDDEREQTPDMYRDSSLGMFESGNADHTESASDQDDDDEMYDDGYEEEMDYEEELMPEHGDVVSDDDDDEELEGMGGMENMGDIEGMPGDVSIEIDMEDDEDESGDEEDEDGDDADEEFADQDFDEITGDDDNASLAEGEDEGDWEDDGFEAPNDDGSAHNGALEHIAHVLGAAQADLNNMDPSDGDEPDDGIVRIIGDGDEEYFEDELPPDADEDEDEVDYAEDIVFEPEDEDDEDGGWAWDAHAMGAGAPAILSGGHMHHHHHHHRDFNDMLGMLGGGALRATNIRTHRPAPNIRDEDGANPLLQRDSNSNANRDRDNEASGRSGARRSLFPRHGEILQDLVAAVGQQPGHTGVINVNIDPGHMPNLSALPPMFALHHGHGGQPAMIDIDPRRPWREQVPPGIVGRWPDFRPPGARIHDRGNSSNDEVEALVFRPIPTSMRWQEEARILFSGNYHEKATRIINTLLRALVPVAMEAKRIREKEEGERRLAEEKAAEEARKKAEAEKAEREAREKKERDEREAQEREEAAARAREEAEQAAQAASEDQEASGMEGVEQEVQNASASDGRSHAPETEDAPAERVTVTIRGRELDITSLGIDREYIEALPEDMREEVIMTQFAEQRHQQVESGGDPSEISREFLDALPREIQQEVLRSEQIDRRRREREEARRHGAQEGGATVQPEEMNNADFMAMLEPALRQAVLMEADDTVLASLPEALQAEARALFGGRRMPRDPSGRLGRGLEAAEARLLNGQSSNGRAPENPHETGKQRRPVGQMLDKAGVATLLRLMFVSLNHKAKTHLHGIFSDVCKNAPNRAEVISILLAILQDGTADMNAVERSFAQLSLRAKQTPSGSKSTPSKRNLAAQPGITPSTELSPLNIVQQCLGTLHALSTDNQRVNSFFLNEHETITSQKAKTSKKGKGRENKAFKFPLNALLTLLDRKLITENTAVMETLAALLSTVTRPLMMLIRRAKEGEEAEQPQAETIQEPETGTAGEHAHTSDVIMQEPMSTEQSEAVEASTSAEAESTNGQKAIATSSTDRKKQRDLIPPDVPHDNMRLVVNILAARECPSKTFSDTLDIIRNLSAIPGAKEVFGKELVRQAQDLGQTLLTDLEELAKQINKAQTGTDLQGMALASFSSAGAKQRRLLRVLVALDYLFYPKRHPMASGPMVSESDARQKLKGDILTTLYESSAFDKLWHNLSVCLTAIRQRGNMVNVATILLPLIESLMVVCRNNAPKDLPSDAPPGSPAPAARMEALFFKFTEEHRKVLNELIRDNPKLMNGNLSVLAKNSKILEFDNKRSYFNRKIHDRRSEARVSHPNLQLSVRRDQVFLDSFKSLYYKTGNEIKYGKLNIRFHGEEGIDAGGVSREWFAAMARQMFNPDYALFNPVASDRTTFHPNTLSGINTEHLMFFKFIGRIIGKALYENRVLDCHFSRAVYKRILGKAVSLKDMETLDLEYYKSQVWMLENDITNVAFETFSEPFDRFGVTEVVDLIPNGREVPVTEENKQEYVRLVVDYRLIKSVQDQLDSFLEGFHEIIPAELVSIFTEQELELLISGLPDIDVDDWKNNAEYHNYQPTSPQIQWFWRAVRSFDKEEKAKLLQFVTGTSKVPLNGFKELEGMNGFAKFNIHRDYSSKEKLPSSHTCFNQLDLPEYDSYEHLRQQLYTAITAGSEYFGFA